MTARDRYRQPRSKIAVEHHLGLVNAAVPTCCATGLERRSDLDDDRSRDISGPVRKISRCEPQHSSHLAGTDYCNANISNDQLVIPGGATQNACCPYRCQIFGLARQKVHFIAFGTSYVLLLTRELLNHLHQIAIIIMEQK